MNTPKPKPKAITKLEAQRILLVAEQTRKLKLKNDFMTRQLLSASDVAIAWQKTLMQFRARILELPNKLTPLIQAANSYSEAEEIVRACCSEALSELSEFDVNQFATGFEQFADADEDDAEKPESNAKQEKPKSKKSDKHSA